MKLSLLSPCTDIKDIKVDKGLELQWVGYVSGLLSHPTSLVTDTSYTLTHRAPWRHGTWSILVEVMACCLFGVNSLFEPMLTYCQLDPKEQT